MRRCFVPAVKAGLLLMMLVVAVFNALARERVLYQFSGGADGSNPYFGIVFDGKGNAYGTTYFGGTYGWGTIFRLEPSSHGWAEQVLYSFRGTSDGLNPAGNLVIDATGNLYGTTEYGGNGVGCTQGSNNCGGTVFELMRSNGGWKHLVLYNFCSRFGCTDGSDPIGLTLDKAGNLYGITIGGGESCSSGGCGTVYRLSHLHGSWSEKVLHAFSGGDDGIVPSPGIMIDKSGNLYGTTCCGGSYGYGLVFELSPVKRRWKEVLIYTFDGSSGNNASPNGSLTLDAAGNIYGTTPGYSGYCCGVVFKLSRSRGQWLESVVYTFDGTHGTHPNPGLIVDSAGNFYGSTILGGQDNFGEVFELRPGKTWTIKLLYSFTGAVDENPNPGLIFGPGGGLYGTTPGSYYQQYQGEVFEVLQ
jgi:uncharacterized repeat protein (TIGR03803 family)